MPRASAAYQQASDQSAAARHDALCDPLACQRHPPLGVAALDEGLHLVVRDRLHASAALLEPG
jgi:hypothetical protein